MNNTKNKDSIYAWSDGNRDGFAIIDPNDVNRAIVFMFATKRMLCGGDYLSELMRDNAENAGMSVDYDSLPAFVCYGDVEDLSLPIPTLALYDEKMPSKAWRNAQEILTDIQGLA